MWANTIYELADPYNATIDVYVKLCHLFGKREGPGICLTTTGLLGIKLCHQYG